MWAHGLAACLGVWLMASPAVLGLEGGPRVAVLVAGPLIAALGVVAMTEVTRGVRWVNVGLGLALAVSGVVIAQPWPGRLDAIGAGLLVAGLSLVRGPVSGSYGGGWKAIGRGGE